MKPDELTPSALLKFFSELEAGGADGEECEIHYGCSCVIHKGLRAAQMLVDIQRMLGVGEGAPASMAPEKLEAEKMSARIMEVEAALMKPLGPPPVDAAKTAEALSEAESEIDRLLLQNMELKSDNGKLKEKIRELYKQIERLYTRSEMSKLLGGLEESKAKEERRAQEEAGEAPPAPERVAAAEETPAEGAPEAGPAAESPDAGTEAPAENGAGEPSEAAEGGAEPEAAGAKPPPAD